MGTSARGRSYEGSRHAHSGSRISVVMWRWGIPEQYHVEPFGDDMFLCLQRGFGTAVLVRLCRISADRSIRPRSALGFCSVALNSVGSTGGLSTFPISTAVSPLPMPPTSL